MSGLKALPRIWPYSTLEVRIAQLKLCVPWLVSGRGLRDEPAGCATIDSVSSWGISGPSTRSMKVDPLLLCDRDGAEMGYVRRGHPAQIAATHGPPAHLFTRACPRVPTVS